MMKKTLLLGLALFGMLFGFAAAQNHSTTITPDHPLYETKLAAESGVENMAPNESERVKAKLDQASERANETEELVEENKTELANQTSNAYAEEMQEVNDLGDTVSDLAQEQKIDELVAKATMHHSQVLAKVYERVPEEAKKGIGTALNTSVKGHTKAVDAMAARGQPMDVGNISKQIPDSVKDKAGLRSSLPGGTGDKGPDGTGGQGGGNDTGGPPSDTGGSDTGYY
jgi:alanyl-tRNA synthetase